MTTVREGERKTECVVCGGSALVSEQPPHYVFKEHRPLQCETCGLYSIDRCAIECLNANEEAKAELSRWLAGSKDAKGHRIVVEDATRLAFPDGLIPYSLKKPLD